MLPTEHLVIRSGSEAHKFDVEIASSELEREIGLMFRKNLDADKGMLFVFKTDQIQSFWMRNTLIPLDMVFIRGDGTIAKIHSMAKPHDLTGISSEEAVSAVLELRGGEAEKRGLAAGDKVISQHFPK